MNYDVAILGAGTMGGAIARTLCSQGAGVRVYVRSEERARALADIDWTHRDSPSATVAGANVILSCVSDNDASQDVWFGPNGACDAALPSTPCLEMSTLTLDYTDYWIAQLTSRGLRPIDCPVTGSRACAETGSLVAFVGAAPGVFPTAEKLLQTITQKRIYFGHAGKAMRFKLAYNTIGAGICAAFAEGVALMEAVEIDMEVALSALEEGGWTAAVAKSKGREMAAHDYSAVAFRTALMLKDLEYAERSFADSGVKRLLGGVVRDLYKKACEDGYGDQDFSSVLEAVTFAPAAQDHA